jgi:ankyrin repeat protein
VFLSVVVAAAPPATVNKIPSKLIKLLNHVSSKSSSSNLISDHHLPLLLEPFRYASESDGSYDSRSGDLSLSLSLSVLAATTSATKPSSDSTSAVGANSVSLNEEQILEFIKLFLEYGSSISICDGKGNTALHYAAMKGYDKIGKYLLNKGCSVNYQNNDGNAPVHLASLHGHAPFLEMLASLGKNLVLFCFIFILISLSLSLSVSLSLSLSPLIAL